MVQQRSLQKMSKFRIQYCLYIQRIFTYRKLELSKIFKKAKIYPWSKLGNRVGFMILERKITVIMKNQCLVLGRESPLLFFFEKKALKLEEWMEKPVFYETTQPVS